MQTRRRLCGQWYLTMHMIILFRLQACSFIWGCELHQLGAAKIRIEICRDEEDEPNRIYIIEILIDLHHYAQLTLVMQCINAFIAGLCFRLCRPGQCGSGLGRRKSIDTPLVSVLSHRKELGCMDTNKR